MKEYILAIAGVVLLTAVVSIIAPSGKMGKFIKGAMRLAILVVLISPFVSWMGGGELSLSTAKMKEDSGYFSYCAELLSEEDEKQIASSLQEEYGVTAQVQVTRGADAAFSYRKISVKIFDFGIMGQDEHIDIMSRIQEALQAKYGCVAEVA